MAALTLVAQLLFASVELWTPPSQVPAPMAAPLQFPFERRQVADGVYAYIESGIHAVVSSNVTAVIGRDAVLVFDAGSHPAASAAIAADIKTLTNKPVKYLVISHWHDDHFMGAPQFADAFPGLTEMAHPFTAQLMETRRDGIRGAACREVYQKNSKPMHEQLDTARTATPPISAERIKRLAEFVSDVDNAEAECDSIRYRAVDRTVATDETIDLGGRTVQLKFLGRGNTAGDLIAWLPESATLLTGDLVVHPFPYATQSYITEWAVILHNLEQMAPRNMVPGHGPVMTDLTYVRQLIALLEALDRQARAAYVAGMTVEELSKKIDLSAVREPIVHGDAFIAANFDNMMTSAIDRMWQQLAGRLKPEGIEKDR